ncbi:hypothetical protein RP20_CCG021701 [Aedes albopictus]|nr:hypothetical protein RP20_CCG021701 [Aedes albopictus]
MASIRRNTLVVDFSVLPSRPDVEKVHQFLERDIELQLSDVKSLQLHNTRKCVFIEMVNNDTALRYQNKHNIKRVFVHNKKEFKIPVYVDSEAVSVRVHDLPPSVHHTTVANFMAQFGEVASIQSERWKHYFPGVPNGIRVLQMRIKKPIPSYVTINGEVCFVEHQNQIRTCKWCSRAVHPKQKCLEVAATANKNTAIGTASSIETPFSDADFPPINSIQTTNNTQATKQRRTKADDDDDEALVQSGPVVALHTDQQIITIDDNDNDDDCDGNSSSSPYETNDSTNKRRMSTKRTKEKKKQCYNSGLQNDCNPNWLTNIN